MKLKTIGIIGGMGALATVDLFQKIVINTYAECDQEHIPVLIDNNTQIPDRTEYLTKNGINPLDALIFSASRLEKMGADFLLLSCNTAHSLYNKLSSCIGIPIINMLEETAREVSNMGIKKVGMLGTKGFIKGVDYKSFYNDFGIDVLCPTSTEQNAVSELIYQGVKAQKDDIDTKPFSKLLKRLSNAGAETFVLSCTELPIAFSKFKFRNKYPRIDPALILARKAILTAGGTLLTS